MNELTSASQASLIIIESVPLERNPAAVYLASLSESGRRTQQQALNAIAEILTGGHADAFTCNWGNVRYQHTAAIRTRLSETYAPATANKMLSGLRRVLKDAWKLGYLTAEDYHRAVSVENVKGSTLPSGRELSAGEIAALMHTCENDPSPAGPRDAAIIALMYVGGLRRAEVVTLDVEDYDPEKGRLLVRGKRRKERTAYLVSGAKRAMADWLAIRGDEPGSLFWPINKGGKMTNRKMTTQAIYNLLEKRAGQSGVKEFSPHDLRRTFVSDLLDAGADIATVAKMAGHASVQTTARYDRRPEEAKQKAAGLLHVPYRERIV